MKRGPGRFPSKRGRRAPQDRISNLRLSPSFGLRRSARPDGHPDARPDEAVKLSVVVGLGNPGRSYERTRHNAGFLVADDLVCRYGGSWRKRKRAEAAQVSLPGPRDITLLKPTTFMNNSGAAVAGFGAGQLLVVHDDLDLPAGDVRVKVGGGAGGHNGLRSIIGQVGNDFVRVRIGIGRPPVGVSVTDYVLGRMDASVREAVPLAADAVEAVIELGTEAAMNRFNERA